MLLYAIFATVVQLVERLLAKEKVAGSSPVRRSRAWVIAISNNASEARGFSSPVRRSSRSYCKFLSYSWGGSQVGHGTGLKNRRCGFDSHPPHQIFYPITTVNNWCHFHLFGGNLNRYILLNAVVSTVGFLLSTLSLHT